MSLSGNDTLKLSGAMMLGYGVQAIAIPDDMMKMFFKEDEQPTASPMWSSLAGAFMLGTGLPMLKLGVDGKADKGSLLMATGLMAAGAGHMAVNAKKFKPEMLAVNAAMVGGVTYLNAMALKNA